MCSHGMSPTLITAKFGQTNHGIIVRGEMITQHLLVMSMYSVKRLCAINNEYCSIYWCR